MTDQVLLYVLLLLALAIGFALGQRARRRAATAVGTLGTDTLTGLAHLLDDQPGRAALALVERLEITPDTLDTHLALATLVRRRGEVDQAILIHQRLLARPVLGRRDLARVELELARDYLAAGLLDRAESLLKDLARAPELREDARALLLDVYERERDWDSAVAVARSLLGRNRRGIRRALAHYLCETAEQAKARGDLLAARKDLREALGHDERCVRASLLLGRTELAAGNPRDALRALRRVPQQDPAFVSEVLDDLERCFPAAPDGPRQRTAAPWLPGRGDQHRDWRRLLERLLEDAPSVAVVSRLSRCIEQEEGQEAAHAFLAARLAERPSMRGLDQLLALRLRQQDDAPDGLAATDLQVLKRFVETLTARAPAYQCSNCGLAGQLLHWQCPSCRHWGSTVPVHGVDGD